MTPEKLIYMANQIAVFFQSQGPEKAAAGFAEHINKFWAPQMRQELLAHIASGGEGLLPLCIEASTLIKSPKPLQSGTFAAHQPSN